jgi:hypothetical protein
MNPNAAANAQITSARAVARKEGVGLPAINGTVIKIESAPIETADRSASMTFTVAGPDFPKNKLRNRARQRRP